MVRRLLVDVNVMSNQERIFNVVAHINFSSEEVKRLNNLCPKYIATANPQRRDDTEEVVKRIGRASAIIVSISTFISASVIRSCPNLRFIQTWSTGTDHIDLDEARKVGIIVSNVPDFSVQSVAERAIGLILLSAARLIEANQNVRAGGWEYMRFRGIEIGGRTLCLIGSGRIGTRLAALASALGMRVSVITSKSTKDEVRIALAAADFISIHCPLTSGTRHMLGEDEFRNVKKGAILINTARGGIVNERALLTALDSGIISYACLDVLEQEPPNSDYPLINHPKVFVTPHCAWNTVEATNRLNSSVLAGVESYFAGNPINRVI